MAGAHFPSEVHVVLYVIDVLAGAGAAPTRPALRLNAFNA